MNLLNIVQDINNANILVRRFIVDYVKQEIILDVSCENTTKLVAAAAILDKHAAGYKAAGFKLVASYGVAYT